MNVAVIGACGHVGLPFALVVANAGHFVWGVDRNVALVEKLNRREIPYVEHGAQELLDKLFKTNIIFSTTMSFPLMDSEVIAIMIGTPIDEEGNPRLDDIYEFVDNHLIPVLKKDSKKLILLRSTVSPGTTEVLRDRIERMTGLAEGEDFYLCFCPERVAQGYGIEESRNLPQLIGAFNKRSYEAADLFFETFVDCTISLTPREAEIGKLMTNMWRALNGAFANEMYMLAMDHHVDIHRVIDACNSDYPRMNMLRPGYMAGPCLFKDGKYLVGGVSFNELVKTASDINEGLPGYIFGALKRSLKFETVGILGTAFKGNNDDERLSLSFKMKKIAEASGKKVLMHDVYNDHDSLDDVLACDVVILMAPHDLYRAINKDDLDNCRVFIDIWKASVAGNTTYNGVVEGGRLRD